MKNTATYLTIVLLTALVAPAGCSKSGTNGGGGTNPPVSTFVNPILSGSDPWIIKKDSFYYYTQTSGDRIVLWKTSKVSKLSVATTATVYYPMAGAPHSANIWAPEIHFFDNKWYVYYTAGDGNDASQRIWVLENGNADPTTGTWTDKGRISPDAWSIDGTAFETNGHRYFVWSGRPDLSVQNQNIYIGKMINPWTLDTTVIELSKPVLPWEQVGGPVNEAPEVIENVAGKIFLVYSASGCWTDEYTLGLLSLKSGGDPLIAGDWTKSQSPVFKKSEAANAYGPGHNAFFKSPDGMEYWIIYHANSKSGEGCGEKRNIRMQQFNWNSDGTPRFDDPVKTGIPLAPPSGE